MINSRDKRFTGTIVHGFQLFKIVPYKAGWSRQGVVIRIMLALYRIIHGIMLTAGVCVSARAPLSSGFGLGLGLELAFRLRVRFTITVRFTDRVKVNPLPFWSILVSFSTF